MHLITEAAMDIVSSSIPEDDEYPLWHDQTAYLPGDKVVYAHIIWTCVANHIDIEPGTDETYWAEDQYCNRWRAFDAKSTSVASADGAITFTLQSQAVANIIHLNGLDAGSVRVRVLEGAVVSLDVTKNLLDGTDVSDWWAWTYEPLPYSTSLAVSAPIYNGTNIELTIDAGSGVASVAKIIIGTLYYLGNTVSATVKMRDFSIKERDSRGNAYLKVGEYSLIGRYVFMKDKKAGRQLEELLTSVRATPCVWSADIWQPQLGATIYGYIDDMDLPGEATRLTRATIDIEGI